MNISENINIEISDVMRLKSRRSYVGFEAETLDRAARGSAVDEVDIGIFLLQNIIEKIFKAQSLETVEINQVYSLFKKDWGRLHFSRLLYEYKTRRTSNVLDTDSFNMLAKIMDAALSEAEPEKDFRTCFLLMHLGSAFCLRQPGGASEFIRSRITNRTVWQNFEFWRYALQDDLVAHDKRVQKEKELQEEQKKKDEEKRKEDEKRKKEEEKQAKEDAKKKKSTLEKNAKKPEDPRQEATPPPDVRATSPTPDSKPFPELDRGDIIFGLITNMAYTMLNMDVNEDITLAFVLRIAQENNLSEEQRQNLKDMTVKMFEFYGQDKNTSMNPHRSGQMSRRTSSARNVTALARSAMVAKQIQEQVKTADIHMETVAFEESMRTVTDEASSVTASAVDETDASGVDVDISQSDVSEMDEE